MISPTACHRCRQQKRRCSRNLPTCQRCHEFEADCDYPLPPDRKLLATRRAKRRPNHHNVQLSHAVPEVDSRLGLLQTYFSHFINSAILFDKEDLYLKYRSRNISESLLQSLLAFSSILAPRPTQSHPNSHATDSYISWLGDDLSSHCDFWASHHDASSVMPALTAYPPVEALLASFHLSLYWFARGQLTRARSLADSTFKSSLHLMSQGHANAIELSPQSAFSIFGVYWSLRCFVQEPRSTDPCLVVDLPDKRLFTHVRGILQCIQLGRNPHGDGGDEEFWPNYRLLTLMGCWFRVREFVHALRAVDDPISMLSSLIKLDLHTKACFQSFNSESPTAAHPNSISRDRSLVSEILHHQCRAVPHLYVYIFNLRKRAHDHEFLQLSALIAVRHIFSLTEVVNHLLVTFQPGQLSSVPPFVGYSTFLAASLQVGALVHLQSVSDPRTRLLAVLKSYALVNVSTLNRLRHSWAPAQTMWQKLLGLLSRASISITHIEDVELHTMSIPTADEIATIELQTLVTSELSSILSIIDITEPFYLPFEVDDSEQVASRRFSSPASCVPETVCEPQNDPMHGDLIHGSVAWEINDAFQILPELYDHLDQLWVDLC